MNARFGNILKEIKMLNDNPFCTQKHLSFKFFILFAARQKFTFFPRSFSLESRTDLRMKDKFPAGLFSGHIVVEIYESLREV